MNLVVRANAMIGQRLAGNLTPSKTASVSEDGWHHNVDAGHLLKCVENALNAFIDKRSCTNLNPDDSLSTFQRWIPILGKNRGTGRITEISRTQDRQQRQCSDSLQEAASRRFKSSVERLIHRVNSKGASAFTLLFDKRKMYRCSDPCGSRSIHRLRSRCT